jgi:hypothetical protein
VNLIRSSIAVHYSYPVVPIIGDGGDAARTQGFSSGCRCNRSTIVANGQVALDANLPSYGLAVAALPIPQKTIKPGGGEQSP